MITLVNTTFVSCILINSIYKLQQENSLKHRITCLKLLCSHCVRTSLIVHGCESCSFLSVLNSTSLHSRKSRRSRIEVKSTGFQFIEKLYRNQLIRGQCHDMECTVRRKFLNIVERCRFVKRPGNICEGHALTFYIAYVAGNFVGRGSPCFPRLTPTLRFSRALARSELSHRGGSRNAAGVPNIFQET